MVSAPSSPDGPTEALGRTQGFVAGDCARGVWLPRIGILAGRNDGGSTAGGDGIVALAGIEGTICCDAGNFLIGRDLVQQFGQHGCVAHVVSGELGRADFQRLLVNTDVNLAPFTALRAAMLAGVPLAFALDLDPRAVDQQVQRAC